MSEWQSLAYLVRLTFFRQLRSRKMLIALVLITLATLATVTWGRRFLRHALESDVEFSKALHLFSDDIILKVYVTFLLPILSLIFATAALGDERDERTLVYLLIRPMSRVRIYLAKAVGTLPLVLLAGVAGYSLICYAAGPVGKMVLPLLLPAVILSSICYASLFLIFGAVLPRPLVLAVVYSFFCETLLGNMPGTIKRLAVSYHCQCMMYDAGSKFGLEPDAKAQFAAISGAESAWVMILGSVVLLAVGAFLFHRKEYLEFGG